MSVMVRLGVRKVDSELIFLIIICFRTINITDSDELSTRKIVTKCSFRLSTILCNLVIFSLDKQVVYRKLKQVKCQLNPL